LLITGPTQPLPLAAQAKAAKPAKAAAATNLELKLDLQTLDVSTVSPSFPSYLNPVRNLHYFLFCLGF